MAGVLFNLPKARAFTAAGRIGAGYKLYFYAAGTSTPLTVYQDAALTTPHASPVVADSAGVFPPIYLPATSGYKVELLSASGVLQPGYPVDNVTATSPFERTAAEITAGVVPTNYGYPAGNILRYGAVGNDSTVNTTAIQNALNVAGVSGGYVYIPEGTFRTRALTVASKVTVYGAGRGSVLKRDPSWTGTANQILVLGNDAANVADVGVGNFAIDMAGANSFARLIQLGQTTVTGTLYTTSNVRIADMRFFDSAPFASSGDKWAILFRSKLENIWIERCHSSDDMQLTAGGTDTYKNINVLYNRVVDGRANGIAFSAGRDNHVVDGVKVIGNYIECEALCIFLGPDAIYAPNTGGTWNDVTIANNTCLNNPDGSSQDTWFGIYCNATDVSYKNVRIFGNNVDNREALVSQRGVRFVDENAYATTVSEAAIFGNTITNCRVGVDLIAAGRVDVYGNVITNCTDGVNADNVGLPSLVANNLITGGTRAILVNNADLLVIGNNCAGGSGQTGSTAGRLTIAPATGKTAKVMAIGNKFTDGSGGTSISGVRGDVVGTAELYLIDNDLRGNDTAVDNITPTGARGNLGYVNANGGVTSAIATGTTVAHGLAVTPTIVTITPTSNGPTNAYVSAIGASTFTINYGGGGTHTFAWEAKAAQFYG
jgi:hypothetical protein